MQGCCEECGRYCALQTHHSMNKFNRKRLELPGTIVKLCYLCHAEVHKNRKLDLKYKRKAIQYLENELGWSVEKIIKEVGRYYD